jgi:hypothetical protein
MKDALANLMNKFNPPKQEGGQPNAAKGGDKGSKQKGDQKGESSDSKEQGGRPGEKTGEAAEGEAKDQQQGKGQGEQTKQDADANQSSEGGDKQDGNDARSGMGKQDGDKDTKLARQAEAMGKLSELYGQRAKDIKGEVMMEVKSSRQQELQTQYGGQEGTHTNAGSQLGREEVPLHFQSTLENYFRRKNPPAKKK